MTNTTTRNAHGAIAARETFKASALKGRNVESTDNTGWNMGRLPAEWYEAFDACVKTAHDAFPGYVVYSYETPIAWAYWDGRDIIEVVPNVKYSVTTSKHQGQARQAFNDPIVEPDGTTWSRYIAR